MKYILAKANRRILSRFASGNVLLAFDYDGTLAAIVRDADLASMRPVTRRLLEDAAHLYPTMVISGRARADALEKVRGLGVRTVVGNHGLEPSRATHRSRRAVQRWEPILMARIGGLQGVRIEDKVFSIAVHYRNSLAKKRTRRAILEAASELGHARIMGGKMVWNIVPEGAPGKGVALERERQRLGCEAAIYVGDDETDEDVFTLNRPDLLTIQIGMKAASAARYCLRNQLQVDDLLCALIRLRRHATGNQRSARRRRHGSWSESE